MRKYLLIAVLISPSFAFAQNAPSPLDQSLSDRLMMEVNESVKTRAAFIEQKARADSLEKRVSELQKKLDDLQAQAEKKCEDKK